MIITPEFLEQKFKPDTMRVTKNCIFLFWGEDHAKTILFNKIQKNFDCFDDIEIKNDSREITLYEAYAWYKSFVIGSLKLFQ